MIGVILAAGNGNRFNYKNNDKKCKVTQTVNGVPLIIHSILNFLKLSIKNIWIVVGDYEQEITKIVKEANIKANIKYIRQNKQIGLINALFTFAKSVRNDDSILIQLADEVFDELSLNNIRNALSDTNIYFFCGYTCEDDISKIQNNYSIELLDDYVLSCTEKPSTITNNLKGTGFCFFSKKAINELLLNYNVSSNLPNNLCDYINFLLSIGFKGKGINIAKKEFNINTIDDLVVANDYFRKH